MNKFYSLILLTCFIFISSFTFAQNKGLNIQRADKFYENFNFSSAINFYKKANDVQPENIYIKERIGNCYKFLNKIGEAESWYGTVANSPESENIYKFYYAQALMANGNYDEALVQYNNYYSNVENGAISSHVFQEKLFEQNTNFEIEIQEFNSKHADFSPCKVNDDLFFVSNRQVEVLMQRQDVWSDRPFTQIYSINLKDSISSAEKPKVYNKQISKKFHEGPMSWDRSKNDLYITRSNYNESKPLLGGDREVRLKIFKLAYVPSESDFGSTMVDNISFDSDDFSVCYPSVTIEGNYMIFASDMPGGFGGLDLYVAELADGIWSNPTNLGNGINTPGNDAFPFIMPDGLLYFSSDGHLGLGGYDIFSSELTDKGNFGEIKNLRAPVNSNFDDFGFWMDDNYSKGYFTSNRESSFGDDDIYSFTKRAYMFEALVYDSKTNDILPDAEVILINNESGEETFLTTDSEGLVSSVIEPFSSYNMKIVKDGYLPEEANFSTIDDDVYAEIPLVKDFGIVLEVTVIDADTKKEIGGSDVELIRLSDGAQETNPTNAYGKTTFILDEKLQYRLRASKKIEGDYRYLAVTKEFNTMEVQSPASLYTTIELKRVKLNEFIKIENIYYDLNKWAIRPDAEVELNKITKILNDNPGMEIELSSHTDCRASKKYNANLSANRAESAVSYLITSGINYRRLTASGYGETKLTNDCVCEGSVKSNCTEEQHQDNRRTVFSILKFD